MSSRILKFNANVSRDTISELSPEAEYCMSNVNHLALEITPLEYKSRKDDGWQPFLLDVRRLEEELIASINGTNLRIEHTNIPLRFSEIPNDQDLVIYCRSGVRSAAVQKFLCSSGWQKNRVFNLKGGILKWADTVNPNINKY